MRGKVEIDERVKVGENVLFDAAPGRKLILGGKLEIGDNRRYYKEAGMKKIKYSEEQIVGRTCHKS